MGRLAVLVALVGACTVETGQVQQALDGGVCPPVTLSGDPNDPRSVAIDNGIVRVAYEAVPDANNLGSHVSYRWYGGQWVKTSFYLKGDATFLGAPFKEPAAFATVLTNTPDLVEIAFEWPVNDLDWRPTPTSPCHLTGCGVPARDWEYDAVFPHNYLDTPKMIGSVRFVKVIGVQRCAQGHFVGYHTDPPLFGKEMGEHELWLTAASAVTFSSAGVVVRHPTPEAYANHPNYLGIEEQLYGPYWVGSLQPITGENSLPFVLFQQFDHPLEVDSYQFQSYTYGVVTPHYIWPERGADGTDERYQVFVGAAPYLSGGLTQEPTASVIETVTGALISDWPGD